MATATKTNEKAIAHEGKIRKFCTNCGKEIWVDKPNQRLCDKCKEEARKKAQKHSAELAKARNKKYGLVNIAVTKKVREYLKNRAKEENKNMWQVVEELIK